jgi:hypothetical protein
MLCVHVHTFVTNVGGYVSGVYKYTCESVYMHHIHAHIGHEVDQA